MWIELLEKKSEALMCFKKVKVAAELESGRRLKALRTDRGGEFNSGAFVVFCNEFGIRHNTTTPFTPQQNGVVERRNQTVVEMARCLLKSMKVPSKFWGEAIKTAVYILNRSLTKSLSGKTPFEMWHGKKPRINHLRTFGCTAYAKIVRPGVSKLTDRSVPGVFLGYEPGTKGYRVYDPIKDKLMVPRDMVFDETKPWNWEGDEGRATGEAAAVPFSVQNLDDDNPTIGPAAVEEAETFPTIEGAEPNSPAVSIPSVGGDQNSPPHTPDSVHGAPALIQ